MVTKHPLPSGGREENSPFLQVVRTQAGASPARTDVKHSLITGSDSLMTLVGTGKLQASARATSKSLSLQRREIAYRVQE